MHFLKKGMLAGAFIIGAQSAVAGTVAVFDSLTSNIDTVLTSDGHSVSRVSAADVIGGALASFDAFVFGREYYSSVSQNLVNAIGSYMNNGGGLVTEWDGAAILFSGYDSTYRFSAANPQLGLISGTIGAGHYQDFAIDVTVPGSPVTAGLPANFNQGGVEFFYTSYGLDPNEVETVATFTGNGSSNYPAQDFGAVLVGKQDNFVALMFDAQDNVFDANNSLLFRNSVNHVIENGGFAPVPVPAAGWLLLAGLGSLGALRRRSKAAA